MEKTEPVEMPAAAELIGRGAGGASARGLVARGLGALSRLGSLGVLHVLSKVERFWPGASEPITPSAARRGRVAPRARSVPGREAPARVSLPMIHGRPSGPNAAVRPLAPRDLPRIALVNPPRYSKIPVTRLFRSEYLFVEGNQVPAMDLAYFAAAAKGTAVLTIIEANGEDLSTEEVVSRLEAFRPDVIVQKGVLNILHHDLAAAEAYKKKHPHVKLVLSCRGCLDAEAFVFEEFAFLDAIARGEIDAFARDVAARPDLRDIEGMSTRDRIATSTRVVEDLDAVPIPDLDLMPAIWGSGFNLFYYGVPSGYFLTTSRGCPYTCTFCMVGGIDGRPFRYRRRDPKNVLEEVRLLRRRFGVNDFYVYDEIFTMPGHAERVCEEFLAAGVSAQWICEGKPDLVDPSMLALMKRAGCLAVYYGVESGAVGVLRSIEKGHTPDDARRAIAWTRQAGILAGAYVMLGFPDDSFRTYAQTVRFLLETRPDLLRYDFLLPYPVTVLHREMVDAGLLRRGSRGLDRRISPHHDEAIRFRTRSLGPTALKGMEFLLKQGFQRELRRSPVPAGASP